MQIRQQDEHHQQQKIDPNLKSKSYSILIDRFASTASKHKSHIYGIYSNGKHIWMVDGNVTSAQSKRIYITQNNINRPDVCTIVLYTASLSACSALLRQSILVCVQFHSTLMQFGLKLNKIKWHYKVTRQIEAGIDSQKRRKRGRIGSIKKSCEFSLFFIH